MPGRRCNASLGANGTWHGPLREHNGIAFRRILQRKNCGSCIFTTLPKVVTNDQLSMITAYRQDLGRIWAAIREDGVPSQLYSFLSSRRREIVTLQNDWLLLAGNPEKAFLCQTRRSCPGQ